MPQNTTRITTVDTEPINVTLTTLRFQGHKLTRALYDQIPKAWPFSSNTWQLDSQLLGWINAPRNSQPDHWHLLFVRDHTLLRCTLPTQVRQYDLYYSRDSTIHYYNDRLYDLLWAIVTIHFLTHPHSSIATLELSNGNPVVTINLHDATYHLSLKPNDPLHVLLQLPLASDAARLRWPLPGLARLFTDSNDSQSTYVASNISRQLQKLWSQWGGIDSQEPAADLWPSLKVPSEWVQSQYSTVPRDWTESWVPTHAWLRLPIYETAFQRVLDARSLLKQDQATLITLWSTLKAQIASLPQIYLNL